MTANILNIRDITVPLLPEGQSNAAVDYALSLAKLLGADIAAQSFAVEPVMPASFMGDVPADLLGSQRAAAAKIADELARAFADQAAQAGVAAQTRIEAATLAGAAEAFAAFTRTRDVAVVGITDDSVDLAGLGGLIIDAALFRSGRPTIVVPKGHQAPPAVNKVLIAWNGGTAAARAVAGAMPFLAKASVVEVLTVHAKEPQSDQTGADVVRHLGRHGIEAKAKTIVAPDVNVGTTILNYAGDGHVDLLVMGAFGHSRLREWILGGVTQDVMGSLTLPTLMTH